MDENANQNLSNVAAVLFSKLPPQKQDEVICLLKHLLSERSPSSAEIRSAEKTEQ